MIFRLLGLAALLASSLSFPLVAAYGQTRPQPLTLERVFAAPSLSGTAPRALKLSPDGKLVTLLKNRPDDTERYDLWAVDPATGTSRMLVDSTAFGTGTALSEEEKMQRERARIGNLKGIVDYSWSPDGRAILVPLDGDLYLADLSGKVRRLTQTPGSELNGTVSETGRFVSFVRGGNVVVLDIASGQEKVVTSGASDTVSWGVAEFIAQEEMDRTEGLWWAPDDRRVAVARVDDGPVQLVTRTSIGADKTTTVQQRYPAAGTANARVDLYLMNPDGSQSVKADLGTDPDVYLARVDWMPDGKAAIVQRQSRDQSRLDYLRVDAQSGASTLLFSDTSESFVSLGDDLKVLEDGSLIFSSERSGFRHLYRWDRGRITPLTRGDWQVDGLAGLDEKAGRLYFRANIDRAREYQLYALDFRRRGASPVRLTQPGANSSAEMDESGRLAIISRSSPNQPNQIYLADGRGKRLAWIDENRVEGGHPLAPYFAPVEPVYGRLTAADGVTQLDYRLVLPAGGTNGRAPVLMTVYGGPQSQDVQTKFVSPLDRYLLQQGFALFQVANRGQAGRGVAFQRPSFKALGTVEVQDQLAALKWLKAQPGVDPARVSVYGWSYGGYMVLKLLQAEPGAFAAGIAGAPVTRWDLYDTHYTEHYLGDPRSNRAGYDRADALHNADKISDPLLLLHGLSDDNVLFQNSTELMARMQEGRVPFETMLYPGRTHAISGPNVSVHLWRTILDFMGRRGLTSTSATAESAAR